MFGDWSLHHPKAAWLAYSLMDATDWQHLPGGGGFFEQDECLMDDLATLARMAYFVEAQIETDESLETDA